MTVVMPIQDWGRLVLSPGTLAAPPASLFVGLPSLRVSWAPDAEGGGGDPRPLRILMVEDDVALANMYAMRFRRDGHEVTTVHDGETGLAEAVDGEYDLVFLDISLPRMDGITVLQRMRQHQKVADRPVVILSNYSEPPLMARGAELGARTYLVKSETSPTEIAGSLRGWVTD
jgi:CheY-like chemotaxis protein